MLPVNLHLQYLGRTRSGIKEIVRARGRGHHHLNGQVAITRNRGREHLARPGIAVLRKNVAERVETLKLRIDVDLLCAGRAANNYQEGWKRIPQYATIIAENRFGPSIERKNHIDFGQNLHRLSAQQRRLVAPLLHGVHGGFGEQRRPADRA